MCTRQAPITCPTATPTPSFSGAVAGIVEQHCQMCHNPTGQEPKPLLTSYSQIFAQRLEMLAQVQSCRMPPAGQPDLSADDAATLLTWLVCHAPNN